MKNGRKVRRWGVLPIVLLIAFVYLYMQEEPGGTVTPIPPTPAQPTLVAQAADATSTRPATVSPTSGPAVTRTAAVATKPAPTRTSAVPTTRAAVDFDYYLLVLSWSPDYCSSSGDQDSDQCRIGKKLGFVLHGLWPEYDKGYPSNCSTVRLPADVKAKYPNLYPSASLYDHEWEKHGTCTGLTPDQYLALSKKLKDALVIPNAYRAPEQSLRVTTDRMKSDWITANPTLGASGLAVYCSGSGRYLTELYVCYSPDGVPTACSAEIHAQAARSCASADFLVRNVR